jgi:hypothetical protein
MGEEAVRQACNGNVWPKGRDGSTHPTEVSARFWLAEIDQERLARNEVIQKSTLMAAWIAAIAAIVTLVITAIIWHDSTLK